MITEKELHEAIAECEGQRHPTANTCVKLASYYTILDHIEQERPQMQHYSMSSRSANYTSDTEFMALVKVKNANDVWALIDELVSTVKVLQPNLYRGFMRHLNDIED